MELTRRGLEPLVGDRVVRVVHTDPLVVGDGVDAVVRGATFSGLRRRGKQLVIDTAGPRRAGVPLGVHLGMTGRVVLDRTSTIDVLVYGSRSDDERWDRWVLAMASGVMFRLHDPRRFARVTLDPDVDALGPDVLTLRRVDLAAARGAPTGTAEGGAARPAGDRRAGQHPRRRGAVVERPRPAPAGGVAHRRRGGGAAGGDPATSAGDAAARREPHRHAVAGGALRRGVVRARRHAAAARDGRWPHDRVVSVAPALNPAMIHGVIRAGVLASTAPTIVLLAAVLVVVGIALVVVGVRLLRRTRSDPAALGPLEEMGERGWRSADEVHRGELLDRARPAGAEPIAVAAVAPPLPRWLHPSPPRLPSPSKRRSRSLWLPSPSRSPPRPSPDDGRPDGDRVGAAGRVHAPGRDPLPRSRAVHPRGKPATPSSGSR